MKFSMRPEWLKNSGEWDRLNKRIAEAKESGIEDIINFGKGDPDLPTPDFIIDELNEALKNPAYHKYPDYKGNEEFLKATAEFYERRYGVSLDYKNEVRALIGSREGISHMFLACLDQGDISLIPDPSYQIYYWATILAGGQPYLMPLLEENNYLVDFDEIPHEVADKAKVMFLNYPNNPTGAVAHMDFFERAVHFAKKHDIVLCHDNAYSEMTYDGYRAPSILQVKGAKDIAVEFYSLSKPYNMTGWRIASVVGNKEILSNLTMIKGNVDSGPFMCIQKAGIKAMEEGQAFVKEMNEIYGRRKKIMLNGLKELGLKTNNPKGTFYIWVKIPRDYTSEQFSDMLIEKAGVVFVPGTVYGKYGEGYVRVALLNREDRMQEAFNRLRTVMDTVKI